MRWFLAACGVYSIAVLGLGRWHLPHDRVVMLVAQHAMLLPLALLALRGAGERAGDRVPGGRERVALWALIGAYAIAVGVLAWFWNDGMLWGDETAYRFQARIFAAGSPWTGAPPPTSADAARSALELRFTHHIIHDGHWFTKYPPLWPLLLTPFEPLNLGWVVNPLLGLAAILLVERAARRQLGLGRTAFVVILLVASPFFFMTAASQMSHMLGLLLCAGAALSFMRGAEEGRLFELTLPIVLVGACAFARPFTAFCTAAALAPFYLVLLWRRRRLAARVVPVGLALGAAIVGGLALYNQLYTGHPGVSPYALYTGTDLPTELSLSLHTVVGNLKQTARWAVQDTMLFSWPFLFLLAGYALLVDRARRFQNVLLASFMVAFWLGSLLHTQGSSPRFGDRYLFEAFFGPVLLAARGAGLLAARWRAPARPVGLVAMALTVVQIAQSVTLLAPVIEEIRPYTQIRKAVAALRSDETLVFFPITETFTGDRFNLNAADWKAAKLMFLVDPGPDRRAAVAASQGRPRWLVLGYDDARRAPRVLASSFDTGVSP